MKNTIIDSLNKILTNTLEYEKRLRKLAENITDQTTRKKVQELAKVKKKQSEELMGVISKSGGDIESTDRMTDQEVISWVSRTLPDANDHKSLLSWLIEAETQEKEEYSSLLQNNDNGEITEHLESSRKETEANLKYFNTAKESLDNR